MSAAPIRVQLEPRSARCCVRDTRTCTLHVSSHRAHTRADQAQAPTRVGGRTIAFYVEAEDRLLSPWFIATGQFETDPTNFFLRHLRPDSHCIDVGANFGYYSCLMARYCPGGRVIGIEADQKIADLAPSAMPKIEMTPTELKLSCSDASSISVTAAGVTIRSPALNVASADTGITATAGMTFTTPELTGTIEDATFAGNLFVEEDAFIAGGLEVFGTISGTMVDSGA